MVNLLFGAGHCTALETSLAPHGVILDLDHTDSVIPPDLEHVSCFMEFVLHDVIFKNIIISIKISITSCNYYVPVISGLMNKI